MLYTNKRRITVLLIVLLGATMYSTHTTPVSAFFGQRFITEFGFEGNGNGGFNNPCDVTVTDERIFVVDSINNQVQIFDHSLDFIGQFGSAGSGDGQFNSPCQITSNSTHVLVLDRNNYRVQIFDHDGSYQAQFGEYYSGGDAGLGKWETPSDIEMNETHIFVVDFLQGRIHIFDLATNPVWEIYHGPHIGWIGYNGTVFSMTTSVNIYDTYIYDDKGNLQRKIDNSVYQFNLLSDIIFRENFIIASELSFSGSVNRVVVINLNNNATYSFGVTGKGEGDFGRIGGLGHNETHLFVTDTGNFNVKVFRISYGENWSDIIIDEVTVNETVTETFTRENMTVTTTQLKEVTETVTTTERVPNQIIPFMILMLTVLSRRNRNK